MDAVKNSREEYRKKTFAVEQTFSFYVIRVYCIINKIHFFYKLYMVYFIKYGIIK